MNELIFMEELNRANCIVDELRKTSPDVIRLIHRLQQNISTCEIFVIQSDLRKKIEVALYQGGIVKEKASTLALMMAYNIVQDIQIVM